MTLSRAGELGTNTNMRPHCGHIHFAQVRVGCLCVHIQKCVHVCVCKPMYVLCCQVCDSWSLCILSGL